MLVTRRLHFCSISACSFLRTSVKRSFRFIDVRSVQLQPPFTSRAHEIAELPHSTIESAEAVDLKTETEPPQCNIGNIRFRPEIINALSEAGVSSLTEIQEKAIPTIRENSNILLASHTGSGKTYAYLLPMVEKLKDDEEDVELNSTLRAKRPRALVLGPTRELTDQILLVAKSLSHHMKFCSTVLNAGVRMRTQRRNLALHQDLVIATPSKLLEQHSLGNLFFGDVQMLVLDEADTLFDETFFPEIETIINILSKKSSGCQFILVAATIPKHIKSKIRHLLPDLKLIKTDTLHKGVSGSIHRFLVLQPGEDKLQKLKEVVRSNKSNRDKIMIFCNTLNSCRCVEHVLLEDSLTALCYHGEMPKSERRDIIEEFSSDDTEGDILVCTDIAARGLDIPGSVRHIINFDFPLNPVDYLHRSGRTARAGASGKITSLVVGKDRTLADRIKWAVDHDLPLDELSAKKHILPPSQRTNQKEMLKKHGLVKRVSFKGLRGAKRAEAMKEIAKTSSQQKREQLKEKWIDANLKYKANNTTRAKTTTSKKRPNKR